MPIHSPEHQRAIALYQVTGDDTELRRLGIDPLSESVATIGNQVGIASTPGQSQPPVIAPAPVPPADIGGLLRVPPQAPVIPAQAASPVDTSMPVKHTKPEGFETPRPPAPTDTSTPMWKNPQFWDAAATAAGPVLGALLAPKPAPNVPTLSSPVAGSGATSQMQSVLGGPLPIDPRIMRPFG